MVVAAVDAEVVEPEALRQPVQPVLLRDLVAGVVLRRAHLPSPPARPGPCRARWRPWPRASRPAAFSRSGRSSTMQPRVVDWARSRKSRRNADCEELLAQRPRVGFGRVDRLLRELHDRARLDVAPRVDVVADAGRRRAERLALAVVVGIDDDDRLLRPHLDHELAGPQLLLRRQAQLADWRPGPSADRRGTRCTSRPSRSADRPSFSVSRSSMFVWHRLVQTPVKTLCLRQFCSPASSC